MPATQRVTVTLPAEMIDGIDRFEKKRSRFIAEAVDHEFSRRRREGLLRSLQSPHPEATDLCEAGLDAWGSGLPVDEEGLVDPSAGTPVHWVEGEGWVDETP